MKTHNWLIAAAIATAVVAPSYCTSARAARVHGPRTADPAVQAAKEVEHLEAVLGKPLNDDQKTGVTQAVTAQHTAMEANTTQFQLSVANALNITPDDLKAKLKVATKGAAKAAPGERPRHMKGSDAYLAQLQNAGIAVTDTQKTIITQAVANRDEAGKNDRQTYNDSIAKAVGMTAAELNTKEKEWRKNNPPKQHPK